MNYIETSICGAYIIEPKVFDDSRGYFFESYKKAEFDKHVSAHGGAIDFIQQNESKSTRGVLRGLHYQKGAWAQAKLVRVVRGRVIDVAVDIRRSSPTFRQHVMVELSDDNKRQLFLPRGLAHGFLVLSEEAIFTYMVDNIYMPSAEAGIRWDDPTLGLPWGVRPDEVLASEKDLKLPFFADAELFD